MLRAMLTTDDPLLADAIHEVIFVNVKGLTTCTQFGVAAVPLGLWLYFRGRRKLVWPLAFLVMMAAGRRMVLSERLALIELVVPATVVVLRACVLGRQMPPWLRGGLQMEPVVGVVGLVLFFGSFEYFRSWRHYQNYFDSYAEFTLWPSADTTRPRITMEHWRLQKQRPVSDFLHHASSSSGHFPGSTQLPWRTTNSRASTRSRNCLAVRYGTPELNNEGGLFQPVLDYGIAGYLFSGLAAGS